MFKRERGSVWEVGLLLNDGENGILDADMCLLSEDPFVYQRCKVSPVIDLKLTANSFREDE